MVFLGQPSQCIETPELPDSIPQRRIPGSLPDGSSQSHYQTINEISAEARAVIASWERNLSQIDYEPTLSALDFYNFESVLRLNNYCDALPTVLLLAILTDGASA